MNVVPGLHSTLVSIPKLANADYIAVFEKHNKASVKDAMTIMITVPANPVIIAPHCQNTGLWELGLDVSIQDTQDNGICLAT
jgi:hypothetical protein